MGQFTRPRIFEGVQLVIEFFSTLVRLLKAIVGAWRRDPQFLTLLVLVFFTLLTGTIYFQPG